MTEPVATVLRPRLTHQGALILLQAAIRKADEMLLPQCIAIVDEGANLLAFVRMDGAKLLSEQPTMRKAMTAASDRVPTGDKDAALGDKLASASDGRIVNLKGGLPVIVDGHVIGGIGVGSGTGEQDRIIANAALAAFPGATTFDYV
ncbi:heme-binding protein [Uliginosibacterium sp. H3]|uniref:Heme-binding protein n=1 Tax=Uliginosibacterium silvisoli TaxID=3114758 RepID=A0ABU6K1Z6_9RHOO|nr:heme-binding protein [Uliginosibacterium sp. H3]